MELHQKLAALAFAAIACIFSPFAMYAAPGSPAREATLSAAICPIVYPVDEIPVKRGYHYLFYGNAFFINEEGYLVTAAHVLSQLHGGQPYVFLRQPAGPPQFVKAMLVAVDRDHDVAILRATPNPFEGKFNVAFLPLARDWLTRGHTIQVESVRPSRPLDAYSLDANVEDLSSAEIFDFQFSQLDKGRADTQLFLFNHPVRRGQSGAPIVSADSQEVVGIVEGQWLRSSLASLTAAADESTPGVGAAIPIHYAIALLQQRGVKWHAGVPASSSHEPLDPQITAFSPPAPLSLVESPFPSQAVFGGEVCLDALVDVHGRLVDIRYIRGESPFLEKVLITVRTWIFFPALQDGHPVPARIGITFVFSPSYSQSLSTSVHNYPEPVTTSPDRAAFPVLTSEPQIPPNIATDATVILYDLVGSRGQLNPVPSQALSDIDTLIPAAESAVNQWHFVPARRAGTSADSAAIVVLVFRRSASAHSLTPAK